MMIVKQPTITYQLERLCVRWSFFWEVCVHKERGSDFIVAAFVPLANCQIADLGVYLILRNF